MVSSDRTSSIRAELVATKYWGQTRLQMRIRRFPPPWRVEEQAARFVVRGANGEAHWIFFEKDQDSRARQCHSPADARRLLWRLYES